MNNSVSRRALAPSLQAAHEFLAALDPSADEFTFTTFDDAVLAGGKKRGRRDLIHNKLHGALEKLAPFLARLNDEGAGIFVMINAGDGRGRSDAHVVSIRAVWQDNDDGWEGEFPLLPSLMVATSPRKSQSEWLCDGLSRDQHRAVQDRLAESYGHDIGASGLSRVLRLPGFWHMKNPDAPHLVRLVGGNRERYSSAQILGAFPPLKRPTAAQHHDWRPRSGDDRRICTALMRIPADDRDTWWKIGAALKSHFGDAGRTLWDQWSATSEKYDPRTQERIWRSFRRGGVGLGTVFHLAKECARVA